MEEVTEFIGTLAALLMFCAALSITVFGFNSLESLEAAEGAARVFRIIMTSPL